MVKGAKLVLALGIILIIVGFATVEPVVIYSEYKKEEAPCFAMRPQHYIGILKSVNVYMYDADELVIGAGLALSLFGLAFTPVKRKPIIMLLLLVAVLLAYGVLSMYTFKTENVVGVAT